MMWLVLKILVACALIWLLIHSPKYFDIGVFNPRKWRVPDKNRITCIALVSALGLGVSFLVLPRIDALCWEIGPVIDETHPQVVIGRESLALLFVLLITLPIFEEFLCRKCLLERLKAWRGPAFAVIGSAVAFAFLHWLNPGAYPLIMVSPFVAGFLWGAVYLKGGLLSAIITHSGYNAGIFLAFWLGL